MLNDAKQLSKAALGAALFSIALTLMIWMGLRDKLDTQQPRQMMRLGSVSSCQKSLLDPMDSIEELDEAPILVLKDQPGILKEHTIAHRVLKIRPRHTVAPLPDLDKVRKIYIDVGANKYSSSLGSWFYGETQMDNNEEIFAPRLPAPLDWEVHAFEANKAHYPTYDEPMKKHGAKFHFHKQAAWTKADTLEFCHTDFTGSITQDGKIACDPKSLGKVPAIDFADFLEKTVTERDYVVLKIDIEGGEHVLLPHLLQSMVMQNLVDDFYIECHYNGRGAGNRLTPGLYRKDCMDLIKDLRRRGVYTHEWF